MKTLTLDGAGEPLLRDATALERSIADAVRVVQEKQTEIEALKRALDAEKEAHAITERACDDFERRLTESAAIGEEEVARFVELLRGVRWDDVSDTDLLVALRKLDLDFGELRRALEPFVLDLGGNIE